MKIFDYQQAFGAEDVTSAAMADAVDTWFDLYYGRAGQDADPCQRIAYTVVSKLVRTVFSEYTAGCSQGLYSRILQELDAVRLSAVQQALVGGECYLKPWPMGKTFGFTVVPRNGILVFARDSRGMPTDVGLVEQTAVGKTVYTLLERRTVDAQGYLTLKNTLYKSTDKSRLGQPVELSRHPVYMDLPAEYTYPDPLGSIGLVRMATPMLNCVDGSREGVSVYAAAAGLIARIDENEAQLAGEFQRGQSRIIASKDLLDENSRLTHSLFVGLDEDPEQVGLHIFSPQLREQAYLNRKLEYLRNVESIIGLQRGMLSEVNAQQRTATEVSASSGEFSLTVMDFQRMWQQAVEGALALCGQLGPYYGMAGAVPPVRMDWGNGVLHDEDALWQDYKEMVAQGLVAPEVALGWRFGMAADTPAQRQAIRQKYMPTVQKNG